MNKTIIMATERVIIKRHRKAHYTVAVDGEEAGDIRDRWYVWRRLEISWPRVAEERWEWARVNGRAPVYAPTLTVMKDLVKDIVEGEALR